MLNNSLLHLTFLLFLLLLVVLLYGYVLIRAHGVLGYTANSLYNYLLSITLCTSYLMFFLFSQTHKHIFLSLFLSFFFLIIFQSPLVPLLTALASFFLFFYNQISPFSVVFLFASAEIIFIFSATIPYIIGLLNGCKSSLLVFFLNILKWNILSTTFGVFVVWLFCYLNGSLLLFFPQTINISYSILSEASCVYLMVKLAPWFIILIKHRFYKQVSPSFLVFFNYNYFWLVQLIFLPLIILIKEHLLYLTLCLLFFNTAFLINFSLKLRSLSSFVLLTSSITYTNYFLLLVLS